MPPAPPPTLVIMAKTPRRGAVKTRLTTDGDPDHPPLTADQALGVHTALLSCVIERLGAFVVAGRANGVLALDDPDTFRTDPTSADLRDRASTHCFTLTGQGTGDLGQRLDHVWTNLGRGPVIFFGVDSPDLPPGHLDAALAIAAGTERSTGAKQFTGGGRFTARPTPESAPHLVTGSDSPPRDAARHPLNDVPDAAIGPVGDGGYWCLAAALHAPALLRRIDWGSPAVYDQTHAAARNAGLTLTDLPAWHDVDTPADLAALRRRLTHTAHEDAALARLADRLRLLTQPAPG